MSQDSDMPLLQYQKHNTWITADNRLTAEKVSFKMEENPEKGQYEPKNEIKSLHI